ncbi:P-loop containing nucleoside triphosphate hydrolase protein [Fragilariopsis cylindrus CCMP1102]|uniref:p-loop containing nucleoside triphosphate hydrolase protein n=1 Tax=Fragilariopsis cylindrus CCMP1102 TaxID=635003 RepID=A0A1E7EYS8_9STRA|nr:P-loop containing nucleoside triphosphate hydrolase protein [Fragilariopsis cylindrus CCMP1102]|eukprot:OEU11121.1 P-loop containing nucleoside triphosphate hydrolase protein [Fragilariopsis cylindrus CCMP1102]
MQNYNTSDNSSRRSRGGYAIIGKNGCGKTLFAKSLIAEAAAASEAEADGSDNGNNDSNSNPYVRSGQITINNIDSGNSDNKSNNKYRHLRPNHPLRLKEEAKMTTSSSSTSKIKIAHVSFDSHRQLLEERDDDSNNNSNNSSITAFKAIAKVGNAPGKLNKAAQFLVIRFGLYPLLHRQVTTLSTGEIRKVLLVRALSIKPNILLLDNAFDGLDISSRTILCDIVSKTIKGFTNDILVQGIDSKDTNENTQVIIVTHRHEELNTIQEIDTIIYWDNKNKSRKDKNKDKDKQNTWNVVRRRRRPQRICGDSGNDDGKEILYRAMGIELQKSLLLENNKDNDNSNSNNNWNDSLLPTKGCIRDWWKYNENQENQNQNKTDTTDGNNDKNDILVEANNLTVRATRVEEEGADDDTTIVLLHDLTWTVRKNERWIVGGGNGAGKSTLSRLLALHQNQNDHNHDDTDDDESEINNKSSLKILPNYNSNDSNPRNTIGWVSTETHMQQQQQQEEISIITTKEFLLKESKGASFDNVTVPILFWLGIIDDTPSASKISLLERPFHCLSQGEQKLIMIVAALALRPPLLVLDEPCQGLDIVHRRRLLQVIERICQSTDMALIYITHHLKEELVPSISHAIHLKDRRAVYCGPIVKYNPEDYYDE